MCEYHGPFPSRRRAPAALPALPSLAAGRIDAARMIVLARRLHLRLSATALAHRLPATPAQRLAQGRDYAAVLVRLGRGEAASPALLRVLLQGFEAALGEPERRLWLTCAAEALHHAGLDAASGSTVWRWFEILSLRMRHPRAIRGACVRYLYPPTAELRAAPAEWAAQTAAEEA